MFELLEKKIIGLINQIKNKKISPQESKIGIYLLKMKDIDVPCYEKLLKKYRDAL
jgi:hypothetical protein